MLFFFIGTGSMRKSSDKQFHYRRLANERTPTKSKPNRPPQPQKKEGGSSAREELLIDISPEEDVVLRRKTQAQQHASPRSVSLLDEPIDVAQEGMYADFWVGFCVFIYKEPRRSRVRIINERGWGQKCLHAV